MFEKFGVDVSLAECRIVKNLAMKWNGAFNTFKNEHFEGAIHSPNGLIARGSVNNELGYQRIVMGRNDVLGMGSRIDAHARAAR